MSIAGPPVAAFGLQQGWEQGRFKAFLNQFLLAVSIYKVVGLLLRGFVDVSVLWKVCLLAPMALCGIYLGTRVSRRLQAARFQSIVAIALITISIYFMVKQ